jgi:hypothetical protein
MTASSGRELYHLQFSLQAASPETFGYILVEAKRCNMAQHLNIIHHPLGSDLDTP